MIRTVKFSIKQLTKTKQRKIEALRREIYGATNKFIRLLWTSGGRLDKATMDKVDAGSLSYRHKSNCLKQALEMVIFTKRAAKVKKKRASCPVFKGAIDLSSLVCSIEKFKGNFDYAIKVSGLVKGKRIIIPVKSHVIANYWLSMPGAAIKQGCILGKDWVAIAIDLPDNPIRVVGKDIGVDIGVNKLIATSDGKFYGTGISNICKKIRRKKPGSKASKAARAERSDYINRCVRQLPWQDLRLIAVEDLTGIKTGKSPNRGRAFRRAMSPWTARQVRTRIAQLASQNSVRVIVIDPRNTSRRCPMCGTVDKANRNGEEFTCRICNYTADADYVGSVNILNKATGNWRVSMVPVSQ